MIESERKKCYDKIIRKYGESAVELKMIQECSELIQAISRKYTADIEPKTSEEIKEEIIKELADIAVMTEQLMILYEEKEFFKAWNQKLERMKSWINEDI